MSTDPKIRGYSKRSKGKGKTNVADVSFFLADRLEVPLPDFRGNGLSNRAKNTQTAHLVVNMLISSALQEAQSGGRNVELCDIVLVNDIPVAGEVRVGGGTLEHDGGTAKQ